MNDLFIVLGNQLFHPKHFKDYKSSLFFLAEDFELCTYEKHHKQKIIFFLSSMRSFKDELEQVGYKVIYHKIEDKEFKDDYVKKLANVIKNKKIKNVNFFEIEDKPFEKKIVSYLKKEKVDYKILKTPMFLSSRDDFISYLGKSKKTFHG